MVSLTFYNEIDPFAATWLENLATHDQIAPGFVNRKSIADLTPADLAGHQQCHFFAGIGGWQLALRRAGVSDYANVWTGSCPCQPFSDAGAGRGLSDPRHLWPAWFALIEQCRPPVIFGEQVASADGLKWLDLVYTDLERCGYTVGAADLCAAGVGAPHQRQRLYFVAHTDGGGRQQDNASPPPRPLEPDDVRCGQDFLMAHAGRQRPQDGRHGRPTVNGGTDGGVVNADRKQRERGSRVRRKTRNRSQLGGKDGLLEHPGSTRSGRDSGAIHGQEGQGGEDRRIADIAVDAGATRGFWTGADWILCRDPAGGAPVARPVEPGTFPLAHGVPGRVGLIRGYGNAINIEVAAQFILASLEAISS